MNYDIHIVNLRWDSDGGLDAACWHVSIDRITPSGEWTTRAVAGVFDGEVVDDKWAGETQQARRLAITIGENLGMIVVESIGMYGEQDVIYHPAEATAKVDALVAGVISGHMSSESAIVQLHGRRQREDFRDQLGIEVVR
jgi:hypothetical protein